MNLMAIFALQAVVGGSIPAFNAYFNAHKTYSDFAAKPWTTFTKEIPVSSTLLESIPKEKDLEPSDCTRRFLSIFGCYPYYSCSFTDKDKEEALALMYAGADPHFIQSEKAHEEFPVLPALVFKGLHKKYAKEKIHFLLAQCHVGLASKTSRGRNALYFIENEHEAKLLLPYAKESDVFTKDCNNRTPFEHVVRILHDTRFRLYDKLLTKTTALFIKKFPALVNYQAENSKITFLHTMLYEGDFSNDQENDCVKKYIGKSLELAYRGVCKPDLTLQDSKGNTCLHYAMVGGGYKFIEYFLAQAYAYRGKKYIQDLLSIKNNSDAQAVDLARGEKKEISPATTSRRAGSI